MGVCLRFFLYGCWLACCWSRC